MSFDRRRYQHIFPSLLQVYSHHQSNEMVTTAIEVSDHFISCHWSTSLISGQERKEFEFFDNLTSHGVTKLTEVTGSDSLSFALSLT